jgi:hypothetical protein
MSCVLRVYGEGFDIDGFLRKSDLIPLVVSRKGEARLGSSRIQRQEEASGMNVSVSRRAFGDLAGQVEDAVDFLSQNRNELQRLSSFPGVQTILLDFPTEDRDSFVVRNTFPARLLILMGELGIGLTLSVYPESSNSRSDSPTPDNLRSG